MLPERTLEEISKDFELRQWHPRKDLYTKVIKDIKQLKEIYKGNDITIDNSCGFEKYIRKTDSSSDYIAYQCSSCGIVERTPAIMPKNDMRGMAGNRRLEYNCSECHAWLGKKIFEQS